jgi:hypothetical protein
MLRLHDQRSTSTLWHRIVNYCLDIFPLPDGPHVRECFRCGAPCMLRERRCANCGVRIRTRGKPPAH